jgi:AraC-like DNA-binding protein
MDGIPHVALEIDHLPMRERFAAWTATIPMYSVERADDRIDFDPRAEAWLLGSVVVSRTVIPGVRLVRSTEQAARDGLEYYIVVLSVSGSWSFRIGEARRHVAEGSICLLDSATPFDLSTTRGDFIIVNVASERIDDVRARGRHHGRMLAGPAGRLFGDYLRALCLGLPDLPAAASTRIEQATCDLLIGCLAAAEPEDAANEARIDDLTRVRRHIDERLAEPLSPSSIARELGVSRTRLYAILEPVGGVQAYVLRRRLLHARRALENAADRRSIATIGYMHGFVSSAHFSRAFRAEFGVSPRRLRRGERGPSEVTGEASGDEMGRTLDAWRGNGGG